jgi:N-acetylmuramoyl-L-alanine amidase
MFLIVIIYIKQKLTNVKNYSLFLLFIIANLVIFANIANSSSNNKKIIVNNLEFINKDAHSFDLVINTSDKPNYKVYILKNPWRLIIDLENAELINELEINDQKKLPSFIKKVSHNFNHNFLKIEFALTKKITINKTFYDNQKNSVVIKIDFEQADLSSFLDNINNTEIISNENSTQSQINTGNINLEIKQEKSTLNSAELINQNIKTELSNNSKKPIHLSKIPIIVIDSGHGGKDPGTIGNYLHTKEKNITLAYAKELFKQLKNNQNFQVYLTRNSDNFISLRKRVEIARKKGADLFISLHANAINDDDISGFSIYTLSEQSSDKQAELLAKKENQADIINGVDFSQASIDIMKTLIDLSQRSSKNLSAIFANKVIKNIKQNEIEIIQNTHRFAGFAVLTAPDMASVLIELGYLSNPNEEKLLNNHSYKRKICESIVKAIEDYFSKVKN